MRIMVEDRNWEVFINSNAVFIKNKKSEKIYAQIFF